MIKAVIFDLDGVLVSTDEMHYKAWQKLAGKLRISNFTKEDNLRQRGVSRMESLEVLLEKSNKNYTYRQKKRFAQKKNRFYKKMIRDIDDTAILSGAIESLKKLKYMNVLCAIGSASRNAPAIIEKLGMDEYIDALSCGYDTDLPKPNPRVFLIAAEKLGVNPEECIVVEDAKVGIEAAGNAKMKSIGVGPDYLNLDADLKVPDLSYVDWEKVIK